MYNIVVEVGGLQRGGKKGKTHIVGEIEQIHMQS